MNIQSEEDKEYEEYLKRKEEDMYYEYDIDSINSGIKAIDRTYISDKRVELLINVFDRVISYLTLHTNLTEQQIKDCINENVFTIEFVKEYEDNPNGIGYVNMLFRELSMKESMLEGDQEKLYEFLRHEITHMCGDRFVKQFPNKTIKISGYSREDVFNIKNPTKENEYFNESAVEMFVYQENEYRQEQVLDYTINTNQGKDGGLYSLNSNLIHQMLLTKGIKEEEFFEGLYDYKKSKKMISKFNNHTPRGIFNKLSKNMDSIYKHLIEYDHIDYEIYQKEENGDKADTSELEKQMLEEKSKIQDIISKS